MLRHRRGQDRPLDEDASTTDFAHRTPRSIINKESGPATPYNVLERPGTHNLSRVGYDEEKCRNVLVRYCAHVPRNYQYKDGIQQIFLILREHLGDENLDLAGGVLYELIEVDCEYSDDPGAGFQRWRHDHMCRHVDLELPHIPHMTTITPSIIPTERLTRWRLEHPERYPFVLSDSSPSSHSLSFDPSCIRNRKAWLIDHTLYVSSRNDGTRPMHSPNPKEFHEMQWDSNYGGKGRLVEERDVVLTSSDRPSEISPPGTADTTLPSLSRAKRLRHSLSSISIIDKIVDKLGKHKKGPEPKQRRRSWIPSSLIFETGSLFKDKRAGRDNLSIPFPDGCQIPNAIFARKFLLVEEGDVLPPYLPISQMPTAESKAKDSTIEAVASGLLEGEPPWSFRGPFTPQLGFDGGLDYRWGLCEPAITVRRFDVDAPVPETPEFCSNIRTRETDNRGLENNPIYQRQLPRRNGTVFNIEAVIDPSRSSPTHTVTHKPMETSVRRDDLNEMKSREGYDKTRRSAREYPPRTPNNPLRPISFMQMTPNQKIMERHGYRRRNPLLFDNIEFAMPKESADVVTPTTYRKITVVERSSELAGSSPCVFDATYRRKSGPKHRPDSDTHDTITSQTKFQQALQRGRACLEYKNTRHQNKDLSVFDEQETNLDKEVVGQHLCNGSPEVAVERLRPLRYNGSMEFKRQCRSGFSLFPFFSSPAIHMVMPGISGEGPRRDGDNFILDRARFPSRSIDQITLTRLSGDPRAIDDDAPGGSDEYRNTGRWWEPRVAPNSTSNEKVLRKRKRFSGPPALPSPAAAKHQEREKPQEDDNAKVTIVDSISVGGAKGDKNQTSAEGHQQRQHQQNHSYLEPLAADNETIFPRSATHIYKGTRKTRGLSWLDSGIRSNTEDPNSLSPFPDPEYAATRRRRAASFASDRSAFALSPRQQQKSSPVKIDSTVATCNTSTDPSASSCAADEKSARPLGAMRIPSSSPSKEEEQRQQQQQQRTATNTTPTSRRGTPSRLPLPRFRHPTPTPHHTTIPSHPRLRPLGRQSISNTITDNKNTRNNTTTTTTPAAQQQKPRHASSPSCSLTPATDPDIPESCIPNRRSSIRVIKPDLALPSPAHQSSSSHSHPHPHPASSPNTTTAAIATPTTTQPLQQQPAVLIPTPARKPVGTMGRGRGRDGQGDGDKWGLRHDSGDESSGDGYGAGAGAIGSGKGELMNKSSKSMGKVTGTAGQRQEQGQQSRDSVDNLRLSEAGRYQLATMFSNHEAFDRSTPEPERAPSTLANRPLARGTPPPNQVERRGTPSRSESHSQLSHSHTHVLAHVNFNSRKQLASASSSSQHQHSHSRQQPSISSAALSLGRSHRDNNVAGTHASPFKTYQHHQRQNSNNGGGVGPIGDGVGQPSSERGRPRQRRRYELPSDDESENSALAPVQESRHSNMTTITDLIRQGLEQSPNDSRSQSRSRSRQGSPLKPAGDPFVPPVPAIPTVRVGTPNRGHRPAGLDMDAAHSYGKSTGRRTNIKAVHKPIPDSPSAPELSPPQQSMLQVPEPGPGRGRQSPAPAAKLDKGKKPEYVRPQENQLQQHTHHDDNDDKNKEELRYSSSVYEWDDDLPTISPLRIPRRSEMMNVDILQQYNEWWKKESSVAAARRAEFPPSPQPQVRNQAARRQAVLHNVRSRSEMGRREMLSSSSAGPHRAAARTPAPDDDNGNGNDNDDELPTRQKPPQQAVVGGLTKSATMGDVRDEGGSQFRSDSRPQLENLVEPFTPLTPWLVAGGMSNMAGVGLSSRTKSKTLIGADGYLENTAAPTRAQARAQDQKKKGEHSRATGLFDKFKNIAREFAENSLKPYRAKPAAVKQFATSLDPREQSLVYCELEFNLSNALDEYIKSQLNSGRLSADKLKRVADSWAAQGRPRVTGFRYDLETQVGLVAAHVDDFRFYSDMQVDPSAIAGLLHAMRTNARQMRARTYCQPDAVIVKHLGDSLSFMRLMGMDDGPAQTRLEQVFQFFKTIVARERAYRQKVEERDRRRGGEGSGNRNHDNDDDDDNDNHNGAAAGAGGIGNVPSNANEQLTDSLYGTLPHATSRYDADSHHQAEGHGPGNDEDQNQTRIRTQTREAPPPTEEQKRQFSGPILEPKTYNPSKDEPAFPRLC